jgi:formylglycine-generating enzyme required for sulfatase activity
MRVRAFERYPVNLRWAVLDVVRRWRANSQCVIYFEELSRLSAETLRLVAADWNEAVAGFDYLRQQVFREGAASHTPVTNYAERLLGRVFIQTKLNPNVGWIISEMLRCLDKSRSGSESAVSPPQRITVFQSGRELVLRGEDDSAVEPPDQPLWSRLVSLRTRSAIVEIRSSATAAPQRIAVPAGGGAIASPNDRTDVNPNDPPSVNISGIPDTTSSERFQEVAVASRAEIRIAAPPGAGWSVRTDLEEYRFAGSKLPTGAEALGRDRYGMWMDQEIAGEPVRWRWIPPGRFLMGSPPDELGRFEDEGPQHWVTLTQGFWMMEAPCTQRIWSAVIKTNPSKYKFPDHPVENVSWHDVGLFLQELQKSVPNSKLALPTEAQWEYACRAGSNTAVYRIADTSGKIEYKDSSGKEASILDPIAWYSKNAKSGTKPVKGKVPNNWGLYDMLGNVWEWCADSRGKYFARDESDPVGSHIGSRGLRGGSWSGPARGVRCAIRYQYSSGGRGGDLGFRLVRVQDGS